MKAFAECIFWDRRRKKIDATQNELDELVFCLNLKMGKKMFCQKNAVQYFDLM